MKHKKVKAMAVLIMPFAGIITVIGVVAAIFVLILELAVIFIRAVNLIPEYIYKLCDNSLDLIKATLKKKLDS